jgi:hypothetical protein
MKDLLEIGRDDGTTGPVRAVPRRRLSPSSLRRNSTLCGVQSDGALEEVQANVVEAAEGWLAAGHDHNKDEDIRVARGE